MTDADAADLRAWGEELAGAEASLWQPGCVCRAFRRDPGEVFVFRMQTWIDLEAVCSPFLLGELPEAEEAVDHFEAAFAAFGYDVTTPEVCDPEGLVLLGRRMIRAICEGFAMRLQLAPPEGKESVRTADGLGSWIAVLACLKTQLGFSLAEALRLPVGQAYALIAAHRCNEGWSVVGETYAQRDAEDGGVEGRESRVESEEVAP